MVKTKHVFDSDFFREEERYGFYIKRWKKEVWAVELDLLYELDRVCRELGVQYCLSNGSLIGAVRDGHFIPWDDDVDVMMLRKDYDILVSQGPACFEHPFFLQTGYTDRRYARGHSQLRNSETCAARPTEIDVVPFNQGIFIDIFVLDGIDDSRVESQIARSQQCKRDMVAIEREIRGLSPRSIAQRIRKRYLAARYGDTAGVYRAWENIFRSVDADEVENLMFRRKGATIYRYKKEWFSTVQYIPFEDGVFPVPGNYDRVLAVRYGEDYLVPKRIVTTHGKMGELIFDVDRSYKQVIEDRKSNKVD
ncbi:MAG: LicD family protein [Lachnospiraceae bacterium]|nr:LicD family protein [Lachnospiraceae bacterium]